MPPFAGKIPPAGRLIGYARVSTEEQGTDPQVDELRAAGCASILEEHASGADRTRPVLARLLRDIAAGETLAVVRLDRLARSVSHLLAVIEKLEVQQIAAQLEAMHERTPRGGTRWHPSSVRNLLVQAERRGLAGIVSTQRVSDSGINSPTSLTLYMWGSMPRQRVRQASI